jgi:hypothetical protein
MASVPADEADVERLRRERREAAAKDVKGGAGGSTAKEVSKGRASNRTEAACSSMHCTCNQQLRGREAQAAAQPRR